MKNLIKIITIAILILTTLTFIGCSESNEVDTVTLERVYIGKIVIHETDTEHKLLVAEYKKVGLNGTTYPIEMMMNEEEQIEFINSYIILYGETDEIKDVIDQLMLQNKLKGEEQ